MEAPCANHRNCPIATSNRVMYTYLKGTPNLESSVRIISLPQKLLQCYIEIYDETRRAKVVLESFSWVPQLNLFEKVSSCMLDPSRLPSNVCYRQVPYCDVSENLRNNVKDISAKWIFFLTASSSIDPKLVDLIELAILSQESRRFNSISLPYKMTALGMSSKFSPWGASRKTCILRFDNCEFSTVPHREISTKTMQTLHIPSDFGNFYHVTHPTLDQLFERHIRYARSEILHGNRYSLFLLVKEMIKGLFITKFWIFGEKGLYLFLSYLSYPILLYLYSQEKKYKNH